MGLVERVIELFDGYEDDPRFNTAMQEALDHHRRHAYAWIDARLEAGDITPREAQRQRRDWDRRHGYR